jgi:hypothetical protein
MAEPDTILISPSLAEALADHPRYRLDPLPRTDIRGIGVTVPADGYLCACHPNEGGSRCW